MNAAMQIDFREAYDRLQALPAGLGPRAFQLLAAVMVPHAARMGFKVEKLTPTSIAVTMPDKRANRNHLRSLHAMAIAHLGEFTTGLLLLYAVSPMGYRTILTGYEIEYLHKARGTITGKAKLKLPKGTLDKKTVKVEAELVDSSGVVVARTKATWRVGKIPK